MSMNLKNRVAIAAGTIGLVWGSLVSAAPPASVSGTWSIVANQSGGSLVLSQGIAGTQCKPINGTVFVNVNAVRGFYCPATGRIAFYHKNSAGVVIQMYIGNVSDAGTPNRMGGTFQALDTAAGSGSLGEFHFQAQK
ncbi:MAG: hypothetical protein ACREXS_14605 [Gammaproteobacteria bacterium]